MGDETVRHKINKGTRSKLIINKRLDNVYRTVRAQRRCLSFYYRHALYAKVVVSGKISFHNGVSSPAFLLIFFPISLSFPLSSPRVWAD